MRLLYTTDPAGPQGRRASYIVMRTLLRTSLCTVCPPTCVWHAAIASNTFVAEQVACSSGRRDAKNAYVHGYVCQSYLQGPGSDENNLSTGASRQRDLCTCQSHLPHWCPVSTNEQVLESALHWLAGNAGSLHSSAQVLLCLQVTNVSAASDQCMELAVSTSEQPWQWRCVPVQSA